IVRRYNGGSYTKEIRSENYYFMENITWGTITSGPASFRFTPKGFLFSSGGSSLFPKNEIEPILAFLNSKLSVFYLSILTPTLNYVPGDVSRIPLIPLNEISKLKTINIAIDSIKKSKYDWDSFALSWDFTNQPLLRDSFRKNTLKESYLLLRAHWSDLTTDMQRLEEENNRIFIEAYGLQDEFSPEVTLNEITLTCNPHYRYGKNKSAEELEVLLLADTMREFISYAVGCMFGRYSLDKPGLILANQGDTLRDYLTQIPEPTFFPDEDNVIPILEGDWFSDDIAGRFRKFLLITFGAEHYEENLAFIEKAIGKEIRKYFLKEFYTHHIKTYKKRPIYWLFSSPKGSFNALIYMHRYRPDTVSVVLNDYLREYRTKLTARKDYLEEVDKSGATSKSEKIRGLKEIESLRKTLTELENWEQEVLYPLATRQLEIHLDDGVKTNYPKFGKALKKIAGLN
ncbi:MAG: BREX-1 system adenine-specific DNA-methyltransferase PglX, partial [bacterium]|nr:BREX-1 system adenine-specific DNA-methyltransferase PglX [bacterium]